MVFRYSQKPLPTVPTLIMNKKTIVNVTEFNFLGICINEFLSWNSHTYKIGSKIARILGVMNRLKRTLPHRALKLMYDSLVLSLIQFGIINWGFECNRIEKLQKRAIRILTNSAYNAHTEPLFKDLELLKIRDIFHVKCLQFWYKFVNNTLPFYFKSMFTYVNEVHQIATRQHSRLYMFPTRTYGARKTIRHYIPELINNFPETILQKVNTHCLNSFSKHIKLFILDSYGSECELENCYICNN